MSSCQCRKDKPAYKKSVTYVSDGRDAMWHLPFPFLHPSDIGVRIIDTYGISKRLMTPRDYIVYWDFIACVVPPGYRIQIDLIPPLEVVLAGLASQRKTKQILDRHKIKAIGPNQYVSESEDGSYDELSEDVEDVEHDVLLPDLQNDRLVLVEGRPEVAAVTSDEDCQKDFRHACCSCSCDSGPTYSPNGCDLVCSKSDCCSCKDARHSNFASIHHMMPNWIPGGC